MTAGVLGALALAAAVVAFVLAPLFRKDAALAERAAAAASERQDLQSAREMALGAIRDLEDDRSTGKIADADYEDLKGRLTRNTVEILKRLDELDARAEDATTRSGPRAVPAPADLPPRP